MRRGHPTWKELECLYREQYCGQLLAATSKGLTGEYYGNTDLSGVPAVTRVDPQINFDWNGGAPSREQTSQASASAGAASSRFL